MWYLCRSDKTFQCFDCEMNEDEGNHIKVYHEGKTFHIYPSNHGLGLLTQVSKRCQLDMNNFTLVHWNGKEIIPITDAVELDDDSTLRVQVQ